MKAEVTMEVERTGVSPRLREAALAAALSTGVACDSDAQTVLALWWGLIEGRWTLVERFEASGRRYYVAKEGVGPARPTLETRERHLLALLASGYSEKAAAQDLGVSASTVSATLKTTLRKLGLGSRTELAQLLRVVANLP